MSIKKIFLNSIVFVFFITLLFYVIREAEKCYGHEYMAAHIERTLKSYIVRNSGSFPESQEEFIRKGFLKIESSKESSKESFYLRGLWDEPAWHRIGYFENFTIRYGFKIEDIYLKDNRLYSINNNEQIFLIKGPYMQRLRKVYKSISFNLYSEMLRLQQNKAVETVGSDKKN